MTRRVTWPSEEAFYAESDARKLSPELDFGVHWTGRADVYWPSCRVSLVIDTGEVIAVTTSGSGGVQLLGIVEGDTPDEIRVEAERRLAGWSHRCGPGGLDWIRVRLAPRSVVADTRVVPCKCGHPRTMHLITPAAPFRSAHCHLCRCEGYEIDLIEVTAGDR